MEPLDPKDTTISEETIKQMEDMLIEINVMDKSTPRHYNNFELRGEELIVLKEAISTSRNRKWGTTMLGAGIGAFVCGRLIKQFLGKEGAIVGTVLGTLLGGMAASYFIDSPSIKEEILTEEKRHPIITVKEALEALKEGKGFYITERHKIEAEDGAIFDYTHWTKIITTDELISFYNIETDKPPRNDFERIGQLLDKFDYKVLTEDGSTFYHAESSPFSDARKILVGKGVNVRKYKQFKKEVIKRDIRGAILGFDYEDAGQILIVDKVCSESELKYLIEHN
jgi:hypothetical protein